MELASTPCGLFALAQGDSVLKDLLTSLFQLSSVPWEDPYFSHIVSLVTVVSEGVCVLAEETVEFWVDHCAVFGMSMKILWL
jgi:hypothetical protein